MTRKVRQFANIRARCRLITVCMDFQDLLMTKLSIQSVSRRFRDIALSRGATTPSKLGVQFLGLGYYYPSTEKIRQVYPVWCSRLHNHTVFIKKLRKKLGGPSTFWGIRNPRPSSGYSMHTHIHLATSHSLHTIVS